MHRLGMACRVTLMVYFVQYDQWIKIMIPELQLPDYEVRHWQLQLSRRPHRERTLPNPRVVYILRSIPRCKRMRE